MWFAVIFINSNKLVTCSMININFAENNNPEILEIHNFKYMDYFKPIYLFHINHTRSLGFIYIYIYSPIPEIYEPQNCADSKFLLL